MKSALQESAEKELIRLEAEVAKKTDDLKKMQWELNGIKKYLESVTGQEKKKGRKPNEETFSKS